MSQVMNYIHIAQRCQFNQQSLGVSCSLLASAITTTHWKTCSSEYNSSASALVQTSDPSQNGPSAFDDLKSRARRFAAEASLTRKLERGHIARRGEKVGTN